VWPITFRAAHHPEGTQNARGLFKFGYSTTRTGELWKHLLPMRAVGPFEIECATGKFSVLP